LLDDRSPYTPLRIWFEASKSRLMYITQVFIFNPTQVKPLDVAQQNEQEFLVDEIIAHRGDHHRRSSYEESCNSWEPYKALMHVGKLHDYLREHRMRSLIPREHK
jgi:hypothetical protein